MGGLVVWSWLSPDALASALRLRRVFWLGLEPWVTTGLSTARAVSRSAHRRLPGARSDPGLDVDEVLGCRLWSGVGWTVHPARRGHAAGGQVLALVWEN